MASRTRRVRWTCPNVDAGHPAVLGSSKPRRDDVVRYCLACSALTGRLVLRTAPVLDARREVRAAKRKEKLTSTRVRLLEEEAVYFNVHGVDVREEIAKLWTTPIAREFRRRKWLKTTDDRDPMPKVVVRNRTTAAAATFGVAFTYRNEILINRIPGQDAHEVRDTCAHELAHILTPEHNHNRVWRHVYRTLCEQAYGVRPTNVNSHIGEAAKMLRKRDDAKAYVSEMAKMLGGCNEELLEAIRKRELGDDDGD